MCIRDRLTDLTADRRPSPEELRWAEETLKPALERAPEHPIGAATGINRDDSGNARFTTVSGVPVRCLYTEADLPEDWQQNQDQYMGAPGEPPYTRGIHSSLSLIHI